MDSYEIRFNYLSNHLNWEVIVFSLIIIVLTVVLFRSFSGGKKSESTKQRANSENPISKQTKPVEIRYFTREEVAKHNRPDDCWLIIKNKVYDVTPYVPHHPGKDKIFHKAGQDNTEGFYGEQHPATVEDLVSQYYIGDLKD